MDTIFTKLNYKEGQAIVVLQSPQVFDALLETLPSGVLVTKEVQPAAEIEFVLIFTTGRDELVALAKKVTPCLKGDAIFWLAYPKGTSKKYTCDFNRDSSWEILAPFKLMPVRQISIDDDWSALRFRKSEYIKSVTRKPKNG